ncbi:PREDICTED: protein FAM32A-like [Chrysochloris asiatica]|uniref:Protein FAM32A n=1 Tax=Chrysochloris asiatica TaxID=185453 RepID=A0A9B0TSV0_CHRAS|nr:PREDICTED: protein FAM32A-like [Chrysochloris asiatica]
MFNQNFPRLEYWNSNVNGIEKSILESQKFGLFEQPNLEIHSTCATAVYEQVQKGSLKLKGVAELGVTKRKKDKDKAKLLEAMGTNKKNKEEKLCGLDKRAPAQVAFEKMQEKRQMERILKKASKTHKQRVEDFTRHLDTFTEHYDISKVSWTK